MSTRRLYLISTLVSLFVFLGLSEPLSAHEGKRGKGKLKGPSAKKSCNLESPKSWLGVLVHDLSPNRSVAQAVEAGALVVQVIEGGPAAAIGVKQGDIIIAINGQPVSGAQQLSDLVAKLPAGEEAQISLISNGKRENKTIKLTEPKFASKEKAGKSMSRLYPGMFMEDMMGRAPKHMREGTLDRGTRFPRSTGEHVVLKERRRNYGQLYLRHQEALGLNASQVGGLERLVREQQKHEIRLNAEIEIAQIELQELLREGEIDLAKIEQKIKQLEADRGEKLLSQVKTLHQAKTLLTDEQRAKLKELQLN